MFNKFLQQKQYHLSSVRNRITLEILSQQEHFSLEELTDTLNKLKIKASRATIFRTVALLIEAGLLNKLITTDNKVLYEPALGQHHDHLLCTSCGAVLEIHSEALEKLQETLCLEAGFRPSHHSIQIYGQCNKCNKKEDIL